jgi:uncharacterized membrane protein
VGNFDSWLKVVHVLAAIVWVGGSVLALVLGRKAASGPVEERKVFAENSLLAGRLFSVAGLTVLAAGTWMVARSPLYDWDQAWISFGFSGVAVGVVLGIAFYGPQGRALVAELEAGDPAADARGTRIGRAASFELLVLVVVVWAMVVKPGL